MPPPSAAAAPFVGRDDELDLLRQLFGRAVRDRSPQLVTVLGEPGVGKTRLVREFILGLEADGHLTWRTGRCLPYGQGVVFWPLGEIVKAQAGIVETDGPDQAAMKLGAELARLVPGATERDWFLARVAPLVHPSRDHQNVDRAEAFAAWHRFFELVAGRGPLVLVFEDLHWADPPLLAFIEYLMDWSTDVPLLVLCVARPELYERSAGWGGGKRSSTTIALPPLTDDETARLLAALAPEAELPDALEGVLIERSGGNPLYAEQFVSMLVEQGTLVRDGDRWRTEPGHELPVPGTAHALIVARLGTLSKEQRRLLEDGAVFGRAFWSGGVAALGGIPEPDALESLADLVRKDLVRPTRTSVFRGRPEYSFWHVLVRDVAYGLIPEEERPAKHLAAAAWIEGAAGDRPEKVADVLAHHYRLALAGAPVDDADRPDLEDRAVRAFVLAGDRALGLDVARAEELYRAALALRPPGHPGRLEVLSKVAATAHVAGRFSDAAEGYEEVIAGLPGEEHGLARGRATAELALVVWNQGETARSRALLTEALGLLEDHPGRELAMATAQRAADLFLSGEPRRSLEWCDRTLQLAERFDLPDLVVRSRQIRGMCRCDLGDWDGLEDLRHALARSQELGLGQETVRSYLNLATFLTPVEGPAAALELYEEGIAFAQDHGLSYVGMWTRAWALGVLFELGRWDELVKRADELLEWDRVRGGSQVWVAAMHCKTEVLACRGRSEEAAELVERYLGRAREIGDPQILVPALAIAALAEELAGRPEAGVAFVEELERASQEGAAWVRTLFLHVAARVAVAAGQPDLAERLMVGSDAETPRGRLSITTARAVVAEGRGRSDEAAEAYAGAARGWQAYGFPLEHGRALLGGARVTLAAGHAHETEGAVRSLSTSLDVLRALGATPLVAEVDRMLGSVSLSS